MTMIIIIINYASKTWAHGVGRRQVPLYNNIIYYIPIQESNSDANDSRRYIIYNII